MHLRAWDRRARVGARGRRRRALLAVVMAVMPVVTGCRRPKHYETDVEVTRVSAVRKDDAGNTQTLDVEMSYLECPGSQVEIVRGGAAFAACAAKYKIGDRLRVSIDHESSPEGYYRWTIRKLGDCVRPADPNDEASYAMVRECDDWVVNGTRVGFQCKYVPDDKLVEKCPWFRRR
jgi:hypothetical protein